MAVVGPIDQRELDGAIRVVMSGQRAQGTRHIRLSSSGGRLTLCTASAELRTEHAGIACAGAECMTLTPARQFEAFVHNATGPITFDISERQLTAVAQKATLTLRAVPLDSWLGIEHLTATSSVELTPDVVDRLQRILFAAASDSAKPELTAIRFRAGWAAATDAYRLAVTRVPTELECHISAGLLEVIARAAAKGLAIAADENRVTLVSPGVATWTTTQIAGSPFDWQATMPTDDELRHEIRVNRQEIGEALRRIESVALTTDAGTSEVRLMPDPPNVRLESTQPDVGAVVELVEGSMDFEAITFNARYLGQAVRAISADQLRIQAVDARRGVVIRDGDTVLQLMPILR